MNFPFFNYMVLLSSLIAMTLGIPLLAQEKGGIDADAIRKKIQGLAQIDRLTPELRQRRLQEIEEVGNEIKRNRASVDVVTYAEQLLQIAETVGSVDFGDARRGYLSREFATLALAVANEIPLELECALLRYARGDTGADGKPLPKEAWAARRKEDAQSFLHAWRRLQETIDEHWDPKDTGLRNVSPPEETGLPSGVAPEAIEDKRLRAQYEAALIANERKLQRYREQTIARRLKEGWLPEGQRNLIVAYSELPDGKDEIKTLLEENRIDPEMRVRILDAIQRKMPPQEWQPKMVGSEPATTRPSGRK